MKGNQYHTVRSEDQPNELAGVSLTLQARIQWALGSIVSQVTVYPEIFRLFPQGNHSHYNYKQCSQRNRYLGTQKGRMMCQDPTKELLCSPAISSHTVNNL